MNITRALRPAQRILATGIVAAVATTCLVSTTSTDSAAPGGGSHASTSATKEYVAPGKKEYVAPGKKEYTTPLQTVDQSAFPALSTDTYQQRVLSYVNLRRHQHHLRRLTLATCTEHAAATWSAHLASTNTFYHRSISHLLHMCKAHYAGETLGEGTIRPVTLVRMWMHSPTHRHVLLSRSPRRIGIGATPDAQGQWVVVANFMRF